MGVSLNNPVLGHALYGDAGSSFYKKANPLDASVVVAKDGDAAVAYRVIDGAIIRKSIVHDVVIQAALDALTSGRTSKEKVLIKGDFIANNIIDVDSYTSIEINGSVSCDNTQATEFVGSSVFAVDTDYTTRKTDVDIIGGYIDCDSDNLSRAGSLNGIEFINADRIRVHNVHIENANNEGIQTVYCSDFIFTENRISNFGDDSFSILALSNKGVIANNVIWGGKSAPPNGGTGGTGGIEVEDGSYDISIVGNVCRNNVGNGIGVITDGNSNVTITSITDLGGNVYSVTTSSNPNIQADIDFYISACSNANFIGTHTVLDRTGEFTFTFSFASGETAATSGTFERTYGVIHDITIVGNTVTDMNKRPDGSAGSGISVQSQVTELNSATVVPAYGVTVTGNAVSECDSGIGIAAFQCEGVSITNNSVSNCGEVKTHGTGSGGVQVQGCHGANVSGNAITGCLRNGIWFYESLWGVCSNNVCRNNDQFYLPATANASVTDNLDGTYTVDCGYDHKFAVDNVIRLAGTGGALDGVDKTITAVTTQGYTFSTATGATISAPGTTERRSFNYGIKVQPHASALTAGFISVTGNITTDNQAVKTQYGGLQMRYASSCMIDGNVSDDNRSGTSNLTYSGCVAGDNTVGANIS